MRSKSQHQTLPKFSEVEIGFEESALVQVEAGETMGYLVSESYSVGALPAEITLRNVIYLCVCGVDVGIAESPEVLISARDNYWCAVETEGVSIIPCPATMPFPMIFISKHGFRWMTDLIREGRIHRVIEHLNHRFDSCSFITNRMVLDDPSTPFCNAASIATISVIPRDEPCGATGDDLCN